MARFVRSDGQLFVSTSLKVMYSSLVEQTPASGLVEVGEMAAARRRLRNRSQPHVLLVRHPATRAMSAWRDKCRVQPGVIGTDDFVGWQRSQRLVLNALGIDDGATDEEKAERLLAVSFAAFVALLPRVRWWDEHYQPQWMRERFRLRHLAPIAPARVTRRIRVDGRSAAVDLTELGVDPTRRFNVTSSGVSDAVRRPPVSEVEWRTLEHVYRGDFDRYGYDRTLPD